MIKFYTIHCPKCKILEMKLKQTNLEFETIDNEDEVVHVGNEHGIRQAPFIEVDGEYLKFEDAVKFINSKRG